MGRGTGASGDNQATVSSQGRNDFDTVTDGDGWIRCDLGHEHWGLYGAAGLLLKHVDSQGQERYLLTHRESWTDHGDTYSTPGGARNLSEEPLEAALRESSEELGEIPEFTHTQTKVIDHGGWTYHTIPGEVEQRFDPTVMAELHSADWFTPEEIDQLALHPGFKAYWAHMRG